MSALLKRFTRALRRLVDQLGPARRLQVIEDDSLPLTLPRRNVVLAREGSEDWCVGLRCPCGCGRRIELLVIAEANPRWDIAIDSKQRVTLHPSVWMNDGCRSHFILRAGHVHWCN